MYTKVLGKETMQNLRQNIRLKKKYKCSICRSVVSVENVEL